MKRLRIFEDSGHFSLLIKQSVQENTSSEQQHFHWGPRFHMCVGSWGGSSPKNQETKCEGKTLEVTTALWMVNRNQGALVQLVKHDEHSTEKDNSAKTRFQRNACSLGKSFQNCWLQWYEKAQNTSVRNNTVQGPS